MVSTRSDLGTLPGVVFASLPTALGPVAQAVAQESVGSGAGKWWLLVIGLAAATVASGVGWLVVKRRTLPPAKQAYVPPDIPTRAEAEAQAQQG